MNIFFLISDLLGASRIKTRLSYEAGTLEKEN